MTRTTMPKRKSWCVIFAWMFVAVAAEQAAQAQPDFPLTLGCVWPFETTPSTLNVFYHDSSAVYWTTPFAFLPNSRLEIRGSFFPARFLSLESYNTLGESISAIYDANFPLNPGSKNPYTDPSAVNGSFHVAIVPQPPAGGAPPPGVLYGPPINQYGFSQGYVVMRAYLPFAVSQSELPKITVELRGIPLATLSPCTTLQPSLRLLLFNALVRFWNGKVTAPGQTEPTQPMFRPPPAANANGAFPNAFNKYVVTTMTYQPGQITVVRARAPTFPKTDPITNYPLLTGEDLRYWSICNYDYIFPYPVVKNGCAADQVTNLDADGYYTYVIATPQDTPANARTDKTVTILPWGVTVFEKALILRNMLPDSTFSQTTQTANLHCVNESTVEGSAKCTAAVMGPYYPVATYCQKSVYEKGGWQACFQN